MASLLPLPRIAPSTYPVPQFFKDLSGAASSYFKATDKTFRRIFVDKPDEHGNPRSYIENIQTGQIFYDEPAFVIAVKCVLIFFATPIYTLGAIVWNVHQIFRSIGLIARNIFHAAREDFVIGRYFDAARTLQREIKHFPSILMERIWAIVQAPLFGLGLELAALSGIFRPLHGRQYVSMIEKAWHHGASYKKNVCKEIIKKKDLDWDFCCREIHSDKEFFLAYCFQERGNLHEDPHVPVLRYGPLQPCFG